MRMLASEKRRQREYLQGISPKDANTLAVIIVEKLARKVSIKAEIRVKCFIRKLGAFSLFGGSWHELVFVLVVRHGSKEKAHGRFRSRANDYFFDVTIPFSRKLSHHFLHLGFAWLRELLCCSVKW